MTNNNDKNKAVTKWDLIPLQVLRQKLVFGTQSDKWTDTQADSSMIPKKHSFCGGMIKNVRSLFTSRIQ